MALTLSDKSPQDLFTELCEKHKVIGATLGILKDGEVTTAAYGVLNSQTGVEATPDSIFQIGSIGKVFTTTLVMQLVDEGRLSIDDKVIEHLPEWSVADKATLQEITIKHLLNHTSGIDGDFFPPDDPEGPSVESYVKKMNLLPQLAPLGQYMTYCNAGWQVLGRIVEKKTGLTWANAIVQKIFQPLGLTHALAHPHESLKFRCAMGHTPADPNDLDNEVPAPVTYLPISIGPAGAVITMDVASLLKFAQVHMNDGVIEGDKRLLSAESAQAMRTPTHTLEDCPFRSGINKWGLGWFIADHDDFTMIGHDGGTVGQLTHLRTVPAQNFAFSILTNSMKGGLMAMELEELIFRELAGIELPAKPAPDGWQPESLAPYLGRYGNVAGSQELVEEDGKLVLVVKQEIISESETRVVLAPHSNNRFVGTGDKPGEDAIYLFHDQDEQGRFIYARQGIRMAKRLP